MFSPLDPTAVLQRKVQSSFCFTPSQSPLSSQQRAVWRSHLLDTDKLQRLLLELDEDIYRKKKELHQLMTSGASPLAFSVTSTPLVPASLRSLRSRKDREDRQRKGEGDLPQRFPVTAEPQVRYLEGSGGYYMCLMSDCLASPR